MAVIPNDKLVAALLFWGTAKHQLPPIYMAGVLTLKTDNEM